MNKDLSRFVTFCQYRNKWQGDGTLKIDPTHISYVEHCGDNENEYSGHSKIHTIFGQIVEVAESPAIIEDIVNDWYEEKEKSENGKIVLTKDDIIKNYLFQNMSINS